MDRPKADKGLKLKRYRQYAKSDAEEKHRTREESWCRPPLGGVGPNPGNYWDNKDKVLRAGVEKTKAKRRSESLKEQPKGEYKPVNLPARKEGGVESGAKVRTAR